MSWILDKGPILIAIAVVGSLLLETVLYVSALYEVYRNRARSSHQLWRRVLASPLAPKITVLMPAYNEEVWIVDSVTRTLALRYPNVEVVVINDGSSDATMERLQQAFALKDTLPIYQKRLDTSHVRSIKRSKDNPNLVVVDKDNGGKADALNVGLNIASGDLVCAIDADTIVSANSLQELVAPFLTHPDTVAVGGTIRLVDGRVPDDEQAMDTAPKSWMLGSQTVEYIRAFLVGRLGWNPLGGAIVISGAFGLFDREAMIEVGGYNRSSIGEDMELVVRLRRHAYEKGEFARVVFAPNPVAWTEAPASFRTLARQRNRWFRGLLDVLYRHRKMMFRKQYGTAGSLAMPYFLFVETIGPCIEFVGIILTAIALATGVIGFESLQLVVVIYCLGLLRTLGILTLSDAVFRVHRGLLSRLRLLAFVLYESLVMHQATLIWRAWGLWAFVRGDHSWGVQERKGMAPSESV